MTSAPSNEPRWKIGEAARRSGVGAANIRYYEREGLLAPQARADNDYRLYSDGDVHRLRFVRLCRAMDMSLPEVQALLSLDLGRKADCLRASEVLDAHLSHVRERLAELRALEKDLRSLRARCDGSDDHCHIIETLHQRADASPPEPAAPTARRHV
jgi:DNA-binding transcriptional MerR regulator